MAKRRKLQAPSAEELTRLEAELGQGATTPRQAPIAQVAADAARAFDPRPAEERAEAARNRADATRLQDAEARGLVMMELPIDAIDADALVRDRVVLDAEEMAELQRSIQVNGLRLPIEVFAQEDGRFGLLSGYRRLMATRALHAMTEAAQFATIKAVLRDPDAMGGAMAAMVEENEVRAALSPFERGRIAVIAAQQGTFANVEAAVDALFPMASKAKRSKIRSFALVFEELGDMLRFPDLIKERDGLKLASALRDGAEARIREALDNGAAGTPEEEAGILSLAVEAVTPAADRSRGGRPRKAPAERRGLALDTPDGLVFQAVEDGQGCAIRVKGPGVDLARVEGLMHEMRKWLAG